MPAVSGSLEPGLQPGKAERQMAAPTSSSPRPTSVPGARLYLCGGGGLTVKMCVMYICIKNK